MRRVRNRTKCERESCRRRATAVVEFAVVLPLLLTILFGIIEFGYVLLVRQSMQTAAREGCRVAVLQSSTDPAITSRIQSVLQPTGVSTYQVTLAHATAANPVETVTVSVAYNDISLVGGFFGAINYNLTGSCTMQKEGSVP